MPWSRISRSTVQCATTRPPRRSRAVILRRPYRLSEVAFPCASVRRPRIVSTTTRVGDRVRRQHPARRLPGPVRPRGDRHALLAQDRTDRLDREALASHGVDEPHDQRLRESSSPAKKIEAARKIAFASPRRLFSARSRRISSLSAVLTPGRAPASTSAWETHRRRLSRATPSWAPTATLASVTDP